MHQRFDFKTKEDLLSKATELGCELPYSDDITILFEPLELGGQTINNRLVVQPMEGYDSEPDGSPSTLTERRYLRYASGGSGMIWYEAVSVCRDGRSNPGQLWIHKKNAGKYLLLNDAVRKKASDLGIDPFLVIQLTHSGRYSKPQGEILPQVASPNPVLDSVPPYILTDDDLLRIQDQFVTTAKFAFGAGFNAVDIKACHGYLIVDLLSARSRKGSRYGGEDPGSRFRFMLETIDRIRDEVPQITITTRLNISDMYSGGFGVINDIPDFTEPSLLVGYLKSRGLRLLNLSMGSPYYNPHVARPYDTPLPGFKVPDEHPLVGVMRMIESTSVFQKRFHDINIVGSAYSWLRQFAPNVGAGVILQGRASFIGFGRSSFAYPSLPLDLMRTGKADRSKVCITCSGCTRLIRNMKPGGCVIRDRKIYGEELKKLVADGK